MAKGKGKGKGKKSKPSAFGIVKGIIYVGSIIGPAYIAFEQSGGMKDPVKSVSRTVMAYAGINGANQFDLELVKQMYMPVGALVIGDFATSKIGLQRRVANGINNLTR